MMTVSIRTVLVSALLAGALGCVSAGTHDQALAERDGLAQRADALSTDKTELEGRVAELDTQLASLSSANAMLSSKVAAGSKKMFDLSGTYDALVANLESELASGQVEIQQMRDGLRVNVADDVLFASGSARVDTGGIEVLKRVAAQLVATRNPIRVEGHTDDVPIAGSLTSRYPTNWELAGARAASVVRLLADEGIKPTRLRAVSSGEFSPRKPNDSEQSRAKNRRIEIRLLPMADTEGAVASKQPTSARKPEARASSEGAAAPAGNSRTGRRLGLAWRV